MVQADTIARYQRKQGKDVLWATGADEHGVKIYKAAKRAEKSSQEYCDEIVQEFAKYKDMLDLTWDVFTRTTSGQHIKLAQGFWHKIAASGDIYKKEYEGMYCEGCEAFKTEKELVNGECPDHPGKPLEQIKDENYFFALSKYQDRLEKHFADHPDFICPDYRQKEVENFLKTGLQDISISRSRALMPWGIEVPDDSEQVMYVWFEALMNYLTAIQDKMDFWPADIQLVGKDITRFHGIIWPAMLMSAGYELPKRIQVHGFLSFGGQRFSKTLKNIVMPQEVVDKYGTDALRFFYLHEVAGWGDSDFSWDIMDSSYNYLANNIGNLVSRVLAMTEKEGIAKSNLADSKQLLADVEAHIDAAMDQDKGELRIDHALDRIMRIADYANRRITEKQPWAIADKKEQADVLGDLLGIIEWLGQQLQPFLPATAEKIIEQVASGKKGESLFPRLT